MKRFKFRACDLFRISKFVLRVSFLAFLPIALTSCGSSDPFAYVEVSGKVIYDDGTPIPADSIRLTFVPQSEALDEKTHARPGVAEVNVADGTFSVVTSRKHGDGIVPGKHKVTVVALDATQTPTDAIPSEYATAANTPLEVDTANQPFNLSVRRATP